MKTLILTLVLSILFTKAILSQDLLTGKVTARPSGEPLPGASVFWENSQTGTVTDADGNYSISLPSRHKVLVFKFLGYATQKIEVQGKLVLDVQMEEVAGELNEVVVIGFGERNKRYVASAISSAGEEVFENVSVPVFQRALQGRMPGVVVTNASGGLDAESIIRIRGTGSISAGNQPLVVVDGLLLSGKGKNSPPAFPSTPRKWWTTARATSGQARRSAGQPGLCPTWWVWMKTETTAETRFSPASAAIGEPPTRAWRWKTNGLRRTLRNCWLPCASAGRRFPILLSKPSWAWKPIWCGNLAGNCSYAGGGWFGLENISSLQMTAADWYAEQVWTQAYKAINQTNLVLEALPGVADQDAALTAEMSDRIRGEALLLRGVLYFELVRVFALPFGENSDSLGVPILLTPVLKKEDLYFPARATVKEVYEQAKQDLATARSLLPVSNVRGRANHFAAVAYLARMAFQKQDYDAVLPLTEELVKNSPYSLPETPQEFFTKKDSTEEIWAILNSEDDGIAGGNMASMLEDSPITSDLVKNGFEEILPRSRRSPFKIPATKSLTFAATRASFPRIRSSRPIRR